MNQKQPSYTLIIGLGKSGLSMAKFLHARGERVVVTDIDPSTSDAAKELTALGIQTQIGFHDQDTFNQADCMVPSPGIPLTSPYIQTAIKNSVPVKSELDIFYQNNKLPVIAITGTNGKTTTTTLIGEMLTACGYHPFVCGNIGTPLVELFMSGQSHDTVVAYDIVVAEISSFQMDISKAFRPDVGVLLNISEDHLDRYKTFEAYQAAKWRLFEYQTNNDIAVINLDIQGFETASKQLSAKIYGFSSKSVKTAVCQASISKDAIIIHTKKSIRKIKTNSLKELPGTHNHENIAAAILSGLAVNADISGLENGLTTFKNLAHRIEFIRSVNGVKFYNDSKATNTDAVIRAIQCFEKNIVLILGGRGKGTDFSQLIDTVKTSVKAIIALGETKSTIKETFDSVCPTKLVSSMKEAVQAACACSTRGDIVLLSPACASFDMYDNYAQRGFDFATQVKELIEE
ncbi:MAG: UDP-N-acetylmuramoyl-L-alanine--D-glutamate ligase [Pseudomonadota bacterium]